MSSPALWHHLPPTIWRRLLSWHPHVLRSPSTRLVVPPRLVAISLSGRLAAPRKRLVDRPSPVLLPVDGGVVPLAMRRLAVHVAVLRARPLRSRREVRSRLLLRRAVCSALLLRRLPSLLGGELVTRWVLGQVLWLGG